MVLSVFLVSLPRINGHVDLAPQFKVISSWLDEGVTEEWSGRAETSLKISSFLRSMRSALLCWHDSSDIDRLIQLKKNFKAEPQLVARFMEQSGCGAEIFDSVWLGCSFEMFLQGVRQAVESAETNKFEESFCELALSTIENLKERLATHGCRDGVSEFPLTVVFLGVEMKMPAMSANTCADLVWWSRIRSIVANSRQVAPLRHEELLVPQKSLASTPHFPVSDDQVAAVELYRENAGDHLEKEKVKTVGDMADALEKWEEELTEYHVSARLDVHYLRFHAEGILTAKAARPALPYAYKLLHSVFWCSEKVLLNDF